MKTATITWITYNNYGTELQAYALQKYLESLNIDNVIVSDQDIVAKNSPPTSPSTVSPKQFQEPIPHQSCFISRIKKYTFHPVSFAKTLLVFFNDRRIKRKNQKQAAPYIDSQSLFVDFKQNNLKILLGKTRENMSSLNQEFDVFICGSDQIWSVFDHNFDGFFYLDFAKKKKVSYAASIGTQNISSVRTQQIASWLKDFAAISVREKQTAIQLQSLTGKNVAWVADPTLLQDHSFWEHFSSQVKISERKYILCYFLNNSPWYFNYAENLAKHLGLKLILIPSRMAYTKNKNVYKHAVGPKEFVSLIRSSSYVLTDSYHGSIFAMQFRKDFLYLQRFLETDPFCQNIRISSLFEYTNLHDHIVSEKAFSPKDIKPIDYNYVDKQLNALREKSRKFILQSLDLVL